MADISQADIERAIKTTCATVLRNEMYFADLDGLAGDGDFGTSLATGFRQIEAEWDGILDGARQAVPDLDPELVGRMRSLDASAIPWDGPEARLIVHDGHAPGHGAVFLPESGVLIAGDMCSDVEIPLLDTDAADPLGDYRTGMERLASAPGVRQVVPGHGHIGDAAELRRRLALDAAYLDAVSAGRPYDDPRLTPDSPEWMRAMHEELVRYFKG